MRAGVIVVAGTPAVGQATTYSATNTGSTQNWTYGSLLLSISGVGTVQLFPANAANGLGSAAPPTSLAINSASLSSLGFGTFSVANPTITVFLADTNYTDNGGADIFFGVVHRPGYDFGPGAFRCKHPDAALMLLAASFVMLRRRTV